MARDGERGLGNLRDAMMNDPPRRRRWHHRFTPRRRDLARIAAVVHALCDRDAYPLPEWVLQRRSDRPIHIDGRRVTGSGWDQHMMRVAPGACAIHDVWFDPESIEDIRVHGIAQPSPSHGPNPSD